MFRKKTKHDADLDAATDVIFAEMSTYGPDSPEYTNLLGHLERVYTLRKDSNAKKVSPDTLALVAGNLLGILIIVAYEQKHAMTSKGLGFILKPK